MGGGSSSSSSKKEEVTNLSDERFAATDAAVAVRNDGAGDVKVIVDRQSGELLEDVLSGLDRFSRRALNTIEAVATQPPAVAAPPAQMIDENGEPIDEGGEPDKESLLSSAAPLALLALGAWVVTR